MADQILFNIAEPLLENLGSRALTEVASAWGFKTQLDKLKNTINVIKDVLLDAEERQLESHAIRGWLQRLTEAVYAADDLFDEFATVASQRELMDGNKLSKTACMFFSNYNQIAFAFRMSKEIKKIREVLDDIAEDSSKFCFALHRREDGVGVDRQTRDQTYSYIDSQEVIGREHDKEAVLDMILGSSIVGDETVTVIPVVGIGGLGKTTLAQFIYNDEKVENEFELKLWVCVSEVFDVKEIVKKILMSAKDAEMQNLEMDQLQCQLRKEIGGRKYLLVLDDVWNENPEKWLMLSNILKVGREGSKVLVTTRSQEVARIMGTVPLYDLGCLSEEHSWALFEKMALERGGAQQKPQLVEIGKRIVKKCGGVPLAIRTLGASLRGEDGNKWSTVEGTSFAEISENNTMAILKFSYHHLWPPSKNCFAYCALFPKDYVFVKETLIDLWMAEGFISLVNDSQNLEGIAEECFMMLLRRCFFQDITKDEWGNIISCKMHDLMHDLALGVAGAKTKVAKIKNSSNFSEKNRHLSFAYRLNSSWRAPRCMQDMKHLRTILLPEQVRDGSIFKAVVLKKIISNFKCLRVLDLHSLGLKSLPMSIGDLIHLRYLDLSDNPIKKLPRSVTRLYNLQTLRLYRCYKLRALPTSIRKLTNLRSLDLRECQFLTNMPSRIGELTSLRKLTMFMANYRGNNKQKPGTATLKDLKNLENLRGSLTLEILGEVKNHYVYEAKEANLNKKQGLTRLQIAVAEESYDHNSGTNHDEAILEGLEPHPNLRELAIHWYRGQKPPTWAMSNNLSTTLPNLVKIALFWCGSCLELPSFSQMPFLKCLKLISLESVEYMESGHSVLQSTSENGGTLFFPALQELMLVDMGKLKGWWYAEEETTSENQQKTTHQPGELCSRSVSFLHLTKLYMQGCPNLASFPLCPNVEEVTLLKVNKNLSLLKKLISSAISPCVGPSPMQSKISSKLKTLGIDDVEDFFSLPKECLNHLSSLDIQDSELPSTSGLTEVFKNMSSLSSLKFAYCSNLKSISEGLEHLIALKRLVIWWCDELDLSCNGQIDDGMPWKALKGLRSLTFFELPKLVNLPTGLQHLTNLRSLEITANGNLIALPEWIGCLSSLEQIELNGCAKLISLPESLARFTSLNALHITGCPELTKRCQGPHGGDWSKIQHIPLVTVRESIWD